MHRYGRPPVRVAAPAWLCVVSTAHSWIPGFTAGQGAACLFDESLAPKPAAWAVLDALAAAGT